MKYLIYLVLSVASAYSVNGQTTKQEVLSSAGGYSSNGGVSLSWTLGEPIVPTFRSADNILVLTPGFQQHVIVTTVEENLLEPVVVKLFPNPALEIINMHFKSPLEGELDANLLDQMGKTVKTEILESGLTDKQLNLQELPAGIYYLRLSRGKLVNIYKIVKL